MGGKRPFRGVSNMPMLALDDLDTTLHAVLSTALDAAIAMREDGRIAAWNDVAEQTFGWSFLEVEGRLLSDVVIPPEHRSAHEAGLKRYLDSGVAVALGKRIEVEAIHRSGRRFPAELSTQEVRHQGERMFLGFVRDISERKEADSRIRDVTERLELAVHAHSIGVFDTDVQTGRVHWSPELERIYGYELGQFETNLAAWRRQVVPGDLARVDAQFSKALKAQAAELAYSYRMTRRDGEIRYIEASARFFYDDAGRNVRRVGVNIDVTERKAAERRLSETQAELIHLSRLNSLGAMASSLSHELNQPLTAVANYISTAKGMLQREGSNRIDSAIQALELASAGTMGAGDLIKRLRRMSSKRALEQKEVSLAPLIDETASLVLHDASVQRIAFELTIEPGADTVYADPILLQQVMFNLLRNAVEAMAGAGGRIAVRASSASDEQVVIQVDDTGPGLDQEVAANLFTAFVSTKSEGMGVGLSICRTIIENNGGRIWAESSETGTSFYFTLPRTGGKAERLA